MNILITGSAGFIGSHLAQELVTLGHRVIALDNLSTGSLDNIIDLRSNPGFRFVEGDVCDEECLGPLVAESDLIFHLAASVGVRLIVEHLVESLENNIRGTETVIRLAKKNGNKKVVLASTSEVYGKNSAMPWREDGDLTLGPSHLGRWGYACSKILDEFLALAHHKESGLPVVIIRLFNTVGPRQSGRYGMVLPRFVSQALSGEPITVYGDGQQTRCFTYVGDAVDAMIRISEVAEAEGQIFNLGGDKEITINKLASSVKEVLSSSSSIVHIPYQEAYESEFEDIRRRIPDLAKIRRYIEFCPRTNLNYIIKEVASNMAERAPTIQ